MVRSQSVFEYFSAHNPGVAGRVDKEIVNAPADIPGPGIEPVTPPGIIFRLRVEFPEGLHKTGFGETVHPCALFMGIPWIFFVGFGVF